MPTSHHYRLLVEWTGNTGKGTLDYTSYERSHTIKIQQKPDILGSSDPAFRGDETRHNPEELLLASLSSCHMLWFLHLCSQAGIVVTAYTDYASGTMTEAPNGSGKFTEAVLNPNVTLLDISQKDQADALHKKANELCFIANSVNFPVKHLASYTDANLGDSLF